MPPRPDQLSELSSPPVRRVFDEDDRVVEESEGWLISYVDVLTLLVTLFVLLLALAGSRDEASPAAPAVAPPQPPVLAIPSPLPAPLTTLQPPDTPLSPQAVAAAQRIARAVAARSRTEALSPQAIAAALRVARPEAPASESQRDAKPAASGIRPLIKGVAVSESPRGLTFRIEDQLLFASGEAELTEAGREVLRTLLPTLERLPGQISVEGHTDSRPIATARFPSNWELSSSRATAVLRYLHEEGIDVERLRAIGYASTRPLADNATERGRAQNRRVELVVQTRDGDEVK